MPTDFEPQAAVDDAPAERPRAFTLLAIMIIGIVVAAGATALVLVSRESARASADDSKNGQAWSVAMAGLTWAQLHIADQPGKTALQAAAGGTAGTAGGMNIHVFDANDRFAGIGVAPPAKGVSNADWKAFDNGHFAIIGAPDVFSSSTVVVRVVGRVSDSQVVLETNLSSSLLMSLPSGFTGCFSGNTQITYFDEESPYDYYGNMRYDGNGGVPIGMSADHDRLNGLARNTEQTTTPPPDLSPSDPIANYPTGLRWRGTQSLRTEPLAAAIPTVAAAVTTRVGGVPGTNMKSDQIGNLTGWDGNPYIANDPRLTYFQNTASTADKTMGLGLGDGGRVDGKTQLSATKLAQVQRGQPIIAYIGTPNNVSAAQGGFMGEEDWAPFNKDDRARKGFYGCDNHNGENSDLNKAVQVCTNGVLGANPDWTDKGLYHSGRAYGFISSINRHCTGSGDSIDPVNGSPWLSVTNPNGIKCADAFEYLENAAACLILPRAVAQQRGTSAFRPSGVVGDQTTGTVGNNNHGDDFQGCHPGCLLAADFDNDASHVAETPYRSVCINLDATTVTSYGPDIKDALLPATWTPPGNPALAAPTKADGTFVVGAGDLPRYVPNWLLYAISKAAAPGVAGLMAGAVAPLTPPTVDAAVDANAVAIRAPGFISERGNGSLITRFDLTDRGPLGTCEQNCLGLGYGKDRTYGAHRTDIASPGQIGSAAKPDLCRARVPVEPNGSFTDVHCNLDYDRDGIYDRKTYAIASSYREECADQHDGVSWSPCFNISSSNPSIAGDGCANVMPNDAPSAPVNNITSFCDQGALTEIEAAVDSLESIATTIAAAPMQAKGTLTENGNWFGGARCHMGNAITSYVGRPDPSLHPHFGAMAGVNDLDVDAFGHPDYWIEDACPDPQVVKLSGVTLNVGHICGCGVLVLDDVKLNFGNGGHLLWRGLVVWKLEGVTGDIWTATGDGFATLVVEGGMLATGDQDFRIVITKPDKDAIAVNNDDGLANKQSFRMNPAAIAEALAGQQGTLKAVRRVQ